MFENASRDVSGAGQGEALAFFFSESSVEPMKGKPGDTVRDVQVRGWTVMRAAWDNWQPLHTSSKQ